MPLYEYLCGSCGHRFERIQKFSDAPVSECPSCGGGPVEKQLSSPAIQFKGSGWYITDYARSGTTKDTGKDAKPGGEISSGTAASSGDTAKSESASSTPAAATPPAPAAARPDTK